MDSDGAAPGGETLARLYFEAVGQRDVARVAELVHPEVVMGLKVRGETLHGRDEVSRFLLSQEARSSLFEAHAELFHVVEEDRVIVEGRVRWMDEDRILRDDHVVWALEFHDRMLLRSTATRSLGEAHAVLASASRRPQAAAVPETREWRR